MSKLVRAIYVDKRDSRVRLKGHVSHLDNGFGRPDCSNAFRQPASNYLFEVGSPTCLKCRHRLSRLNKEVAA